MTKIALVTGANRGIGLEACRQLAEQGLHVILTSRDINKGRQAVRQLNEAGFSLTYHQLDVTDFESIEQLYHFVEREFGRLDVLVNNAAIYPDEGVSVFEVSTETMRQTQEINFYGPFHLCRAFIPLMHRHNFGRVVNVSSGSGAINEMGGHTAAYRISKVSLNALTRILAAELGGYNIKVNAMCPGWVRTQMGGPAAPRSVEEGADTIAWLATLPDDGPSGGFFRDRKPVAW